MTNEISHQIYATLAFANPSQNDFETIQKQIADSRPKYRHTHITVMATLRQRYWSQSRNRNVPIYTK